MVNRLEMTSFSCVFQPVFSLGSRGGSNAGRTEISNDQQQSDSSAGSARRRDQARPEM